MWNVIIVSYCNDHIAPMLRNDVTLTQIVIQIKQTIRLLSPESTFHVWKIITLLLSPLIRALPLSTFIRLWVFPSNLLVPGHKYCRLFSFCRFYYQILEDYLCPILLKAKGLYSSRHFIYFHLLRHKCHHLNLFKVVIDDQLFANRKFHCKLLWQPNPSQWVL